MKKENPIVKIVYVKAHMMNVTVCSTLAQNDLSASKSAREHASNGTIMCMFVCCFIVSSSFALLD